MYKVQKIAGAGSSKNGYITVEEKYIALSIAEEDMKTNDSAFMISFKGEDGKWYLVSIISKKYELDISWNGLLIIKHEGKKDFYLEAVNDGKYTWNKSALYAIRYPYNYKSIAEAKKTTIDIIKKGE